MTVDGEQLDQVREMMFEAMAAIHGNAHDRALGYLRRGMKLLDRIDTQETPDDDRERTESPQA